MILVNPKNYTPFEYHHYLNRGNEIQKPLNSTFEVGQVVVVNHNNIQALAVIIGCIDEEFDGTVRLDLCGITDISNIRPATIDDVNNPNIDSFKKLTKECLGFDVSYNWETYELTIN